MIKMQQFYIYKFKSGRLKRCKYNINIDISVARNNNELVALGDNQFIRTIREVTNHSYSVIEFNKAKDDKIELVKKIKGSKEKKPLIKELKVLNNKLDNMLLIPDYISVVIEHNNHYKKMREEGLFINGVKYVRFSCSASNARVNTVFFINENIYIKVNNILKNNTKKIKITKAKWNAYFALLSSATYKVREPRVCVIPDYEKTLRHEFDFINDDGSIERKFIDIENYPPFDGMGIIDAEFSSQWAVDLELDYIPAEFCIRNSYVKGMVATMPLKEYAEEFGAEYTINDVWGKKYAIKDIDMVLTASQFKLWNAYDSWEDYVKSCKDNNISWGISKVSPKDDKKVAFTNYQFIQALNLTDKQIEDLCKPTIKWLKGVSGLDVMYSLLFTLGNDIDFNKIDDYPMKALLLDNELINDPFIRNKIIRAINKKIRQACAGKLLVDGNFSVMVSDPYALMQFICGHKVVGLLNDKEHYSNFWNQRNVTTASACRSPLTWRSEVNTLNLKKNELTEKWFRYLNSGIIYNVYGDDTMRHADSDYDMDIVFSTNKKEFIEGSYVDEKPITYNKKTVLKEYINQDELYKADEDAFNSKIGFITNCDTTMYEMITLYKEDSDEYKELYNRLRYSRKLQGDEIDRAKGVKVDEFPRYWTDFKSLKKEDDNYDLYRKLLIEKRPYFMRYVYDHYNKSYKKFLDNMENYSQAHFFCSYKDNTDENFIKLFNWKSPLLENTNGVMNRVSRYMESNLKEIKRDSKIPEKYIIDKLIPKGNKIDIYDEDIENMLKEYKVFRKKLRDDNYGCTNSKELNEIDISIKNKTISIRRKLQELGDIKEMLSSAITICYKTKIIEDREFVWDVFGKEIIKHLIENTKRPIYIPVLDEKGSFEYLGEKYSRKELVI